MFGSGVKGVAVERLAVERLAGADSGSLGISNVADVFDQDDLFDLLNDDDVLGLSRLGGAAGFPGLSSIRKSTGIRARRILREGITVTDGNTVVQTPGR